MNQNLLVKRKDAPGGLCFPQTQDSSNRKILGFDVRVLRRFFKNWNKAKTLDKKIFLSTLQWASWQCECGFLLPSYKRDFRSWLLFFRLYGCFDPEFKCVQISVNKTYCIIDFNIRLKVFYLKKITICLIRSKILNA